MPINALESYLFEKKLVNTSSIEILQNALIGIDVEHYLSRIYTFKKEQFLSAIGGIPSSIRDYIQSDMKVFKECNIKPLFIIKGLDIQLQIKDLKVNELTSNEQHLEISWNKINQKEMNNSFGYQNNTYSNNDSFRLYSDPLPFRPIINDLVKIFIENGIDYMVCPYDTSFQLSYLYQNGMIDSIYGSTDLLLTKVDKFILGMEFQSKDFRFIDKSKVLKELRLSSKQLLDISIMVGCNIQPEILPDLPPFSKPNAQQPYPQSSPFKYVSELLYNYANLNEDPDFSLYRHVFFNNNEASLDLFLKGRSAFKYIPILNKEGTVTFYSVEMQKLGLIDESDELFADAAPKTEVQTPKKPSTTPETVEKEEPKGHKIHVPNDVHDIISQRLPAEFYFYQSVGLAPIELLEAITQGKLWIRPTLESGLSDSYEKLITSKLYINNLDNVFNLLTQLLARYYQVKKIKVSYWYKEEELELNNRMNPNINQQISHLYVQDSNPQFSLINFFKNLNESFPKQKFEGVITTPNEVISTVMLRSLHLLDIVDNQSGQLNNYGKILKTFVAKYGGSLNETSLQELVLVLLLIKSDVLKLNESTKEFGSVAKSFKDVGSSNSTEIKLDNREFQHITLLSRIFSIHKLNIAPINYQGPISRSLLNFRSLLKFISANFIYTIQSCLVDFLVRGDNNHIRTEYETRDQWSSLVNQLPFYKDLNNTLLGVIAEIYFEYSLKQSKLNMDLSKEQIIENTQDQLLNAVYQISNSTFNINVHGVNSITSTQLLSDFTNGVEFWKLFIGLVKVANEVDKKIISDGYYKSIIETDEWMKQFV